MVSRALLSMSAKILPKLEMKQESELVSQWCPKSRFSLSQGEMKKARRASDLEFLVAGAGFEPTTFGL